MSMPGIQPKGATNNGNLLIPNKQTMTTYDPLKYGTDMRAIERWCNSLIANGGEPEVIIFQHSYTTTGCGPGLFSQLTTTLGKFNPGGTTFPATFIVPNSGDIKILATLFLEYNTVDNSGPAGIVLSFVDVATGLVRETPLELVSSNTPSGTRDDIIGARMVYEGEVLGMTPGASISWELGGYKLANTGTALIGISDGTSTTFPYGPVVITVYAA